MARVASQVAIRSSGDGAGPSVQLTNDAGEVTRQVLCFHKPVVCTRLRVFGISLCFFVHMRRLWRCCRVRRAALLCVVLLTRNGFGRV
jgi:hypothetical protein